VTVPGLTVLIVPAKLSILAAGTTAQYTATVYNDAANKGVNWTLQCDATDCGSIAPTPSASDEAVTYSAPATPPPTDLAVTLTASSMSEPSVQQSAEIKVPAIIIGITPVSALIPVNITQQFTGSVTYDPAAGDIAWSLAQNGVPCPTACGTVSASSSATGAEIKYTAPAAIPADSRVTLTATSTSDQTRFATAVIVLTAGSVRLAPTDLSFQKVSSTRPSGIYVTPPQTATLTNVSDVALTIAGITIGGTNASVFQETDTCGISVATGSSCDITVSFHPPESGSHFSAVLSVDDSSTDSPQQIQLSATKVHRVASDLRASLAGKTIVTAPPPSAGTKVGTRVMYLVDSARAEPFHPNGAKRELMVRFWYPAAAGGACTAAPYASPQVLDYYSTLLGVALPHVSTNSCLDAPIAAGPSPVAFLEHGFTGTFTDYTFLAEDLASRGYVVVAVDHTYEATAVELPDGRLEKSVFGSYLTRYTRNDAGALGLAVAVRLDDLRFVLSELQRLNTARGAAFTGKLDLARVALVGHSLGGLTTLRALESEPRFKAGVLLDGVMPPHLSKPLHQPVLTLVAGRGSWNEDDVGSGQRCAVRAPA
jgi:predicted dienelactone hydrolase